MNRWLLSVGAIAPVALTVYAANKPKATSNAVPEAQEKTYARSLEQAQDSAKQNQLNHAIAQIEKIPENSRYSATAQQLVSAWTQDLIHQATEAYRQGDVAKALSLFPSGSSPNPQVQQLKKAWSQEADKLGQIQAAGNRGEWQQVLKSIESIKDTGLYANPKIQGLLQAAINASRSENVAEAPQPTAAPSFNEAAKSSQVVLKPASPLLKQPVVNVAQAMQVSEPRSIVGRRLLIAVAQQPRVKATPRPKARSQQPLAQSETVDQTVVALQNIVDRCAAQSVITPQMMSFTPDSSQKLQVGDHSSKVIALEPPRAKSGAKAAFLPEEDSRRLDACLSGTTTEQRDSSDSMTSSEGRSGEIKATLFIRPSTNALEFKRTGAW